MTKLSLPSGPDPNRFAERNTELRAALYQADPRHLANRSAAPYTPLDNDCGEFRLTLWKSHVILSYPEFIARDAASNEELSAMNQTLLLYYFNFSDGVPLSDRWISFAELPDGRFYNQAFQGYSGGQLIRVFRNEIQGFENAARSLDGIRYSLGDSAFRFQALPRVPLLVVYWLGDEDFPSSCQVLFDASASHYLPTDAYAILGSILTGRLIAAGKKPNDD